jgi:hypothetical protein
MRQILIVFLFLFVSGCQMNEDVLKLTDIHNSDYDFQLLLFANNEQGDLKHEENYYDALLALKAYFPGEMKNSRVIQQSSETALAKQLKVKSFPALVIMKNNEIEVKIEGTHTKNEIIERITSALERNEFQK